jgi:hypothetical protein
VTYEVRAGMQHLTLGTGDTRVSFREEVAPPVLDLLRPLTVTGTHDLPHSPGVRVRVTVDGTAALVTPARDSVPLVTMGVAADESAADYLWPLMGEGHPEAARPSAVPWIAVRLEAGATLYPADLRWLGDFERCWAWAWLDRLGQ